MAMRPRGRGAATPNRAAPRQSGAIRLVYEDFRPVSEWQQDDESHILNIYLPGFMKERIRVSTQGKNTIRVNGERLVAGNKWSRFLEDFQVPENGEINSVGAKYGGGVLTITVPKKEVVKPQEALPPKPESNDIQKQPTPQMGQDKANLAVGTSQSTDEKSLQPQKASGGPRMEHEQDGDQRDGSITPLRNTGTTVSQDAGKKESSESKEKHIASERPDDKEGKHAVSSKELPEVETAKKTTLGKNGAIGIPEKKADNNELHGAFTKEKYKAALNGLAELNEERQLLMNMGVAMLVIVAATAYVTYKFASGNDKN